MLLISGVVKGCLVVYVDALVGSVARRQEQLEDVEVARDTGQVERILLACILRFNICIVLDEQVHKLHILVVHCIVQRTVASFRLLVVDINSHVCGVVWIDESGYCVVVIFLGCADQSRTLCQILFPPWTPYLLVLVLELLDVRRLMGLDHCLGSMVVALVMCGRHR